MCPGDATRIFFRVLASIAALSDLDLRSFDASAAHLHGDIDGEVYMEPLRDTETEVLFWRKTCRILGQRHMCIY